MDVFAGRRQRLKERLLVEADGRPGVALFFSGTEYGPAPFSPDPTFYYLTGVTVPDAAYLVALSPGRAQEILLLPPPDPAKERWSGKALNAGGLTPSAEPDEARRAALEATGQETLSASYQLEECLRRPLREARFLYLDLPSDAIAALPGVAQEWAWRLRRRYPALEVRDARFIAGEMRRVKDDHELARMREAMAVTVEAQRAVTRVLAPGLREYLLRAVVEYVFTSRGAEAVAFPSIVGSGPDACVLHHGTGRRTLDRGELVVCDVGARKEQYCADVTRTYPVSGRFTKRQARVYETVLEAQAAAVAAAKPGAFLRDVHEAARSVIEKAGFGKHFFHGTSHYLGLEAHDSGSVESPLEPGVVITVEPGIYLADEALGVRIEDDVLITAEGCEVMTDFSREISDIEKLLARPRKKLIF
jgi:Xaa-Pro aminopeptidase